jgi:hypothetical protein
LAVGLLATSLGFALLTSNQPENALGFLFPALGSLHAATGHLLARPAGGAVRPRSRAWAGLALVALGVVDAARFDARANRLRVVHEGIDVAEPAPPGELPGALSFLEWHTPVLNRATPADVAGLVGFFETNPGSFFLVGDSTILYGVTGRPSPNPVLWLHPGLTVPRPGTPGFARYEAALIRRLAASRVRYVVVEGERTWMGIGLAHFEGVAARVRCRATGQERFGPFVVYTIDPPFGG